LFLAEKRLVKALSGKAKHQAWPKWRLSLVWAVEFDEVAKVELSTLDRQDAKGGWNFFTQRVISLKDPRSMGHALKGS
jgi:hypothetical protein